MADDFSDIHDELRSVAGDLLGKARESSAAWSLLARAGWTGLEVPEEFGGAGATFGETAIICEEIGRAAAASAFLGSAVLGVGALNMVASHPVRDELLAGIAAGETRVAVALSADHETIGTTIAFTVAETLDGRSDFIADAPGADRLLLLAGDGDGVPVLVAVPAKAAGLTVADRSVLDETSDSPPSQPIPLPRRIAPSSASPAMRWHRCGHWRTGPVSRWPATVWGSARRC